MKFVSTVDKAWGGCTLMVPQCLARWWDGAELAVWWGIAWPTALTYAGRVAMMVTDLAVVVKLATHLPLLSLPRAVCTKRLRPLWAACSRHN